MNAERLRACLLPLPHVVETMQWGANLVFWAGDKAIGGKMFALANLDGDGRGVLSFAAGPERYAELLEIEGFIPAPYFARIHWVCAEHWQVLTHAEWEQELRSAYERIFARLPRKTLRILELPTKERQRLITEHRKLASTKMAAKKKLR